MREILFRGKRVDNGEWAYGDFCSPNNIGFLQDEEWQDCFIDLETVGQYTGLTDKNGTKIFEGDIVKIDDDIFDVAFDKGAFGLRKQGETYGNLYHYYNFCKTDHSLYVPKVIGNIHDKQECAHCLSISTNEIGEKLAFCELTDKAENITLGDCFGNCEAQEKLEG